MIGEWSDVCFVETRMFRFERLIAACAVTAFIGFAVAGYVETRRATELTRQAQAGQITASAAIR